MIELAADDDTAREILANPSGVTLPKPFNPTDYRVVYLVRGTAAANQTFTHPCIITPSTLDDAMAAAGNSLFSSSPTTQPSQRR